MGWGGGGRGLTLPSPFPTSLLGAGVCARLGASHFNGGGSVEPALRLLLAAHGFWAARLHG